MSEQTRTSALVRPYVIAAVVAGVGFLFASVIWKLVADWWSDENYSHGIFIPFVIAYIIWIERERLKAAIGEPATGLGSVIAAVSMAALLIGTVGAELFSQRMALIGVLLGAAIYFAGRRIVGIALMPAALLLLAIPIPQIVFNKIAFPLQMLASKIAIWAIRTVEVPSLRKGNVIDILPLGSTQTISLEVVEACSGIRSLMTLLTLGLILAFFTRTDTKGHLAAGLFSMRDLTRALLLMFAAVPIAVVTNAARVAVTAVLTFYYGKQATDGVWHDISGWLVYVVALLLMIGVNFALRRAFRARTSSESPRRQVAPPSRLAPAIPFVIAVLIGGGVINWFATRSEILHPRQELSALSPELGPWKRRGLDIRFDESVEEILKTSDYVMREYTLSDGRIANIYVGYYDSQRTGATYHSPRNCLPGAGWVMSDPAAIEIERGDGSPFIANRYLIQNGIYNEVMIYWYQGRGRIEASEYADKVNTVIDSITRRRTDGAIVRVMTSVGTDEQAAIRAAADLSSQLARQLGPFVPE